MLDARSGLATRRCHWPSLSMTYLRALLAARRMRRCLHSYVVQHTVVGPSGAGAAVATDGHVIDRTIFLLIDERERRRSALDSV